MKKRLVVVLMIAALLLSVLAGCASSGDTETTDSTEAPEEASTETNAPAEAWEPDGVITLVAAAAAGSGYDTSARNFAEVLNSTGIVEQTIKVVNDAGGAGQVGFTNFARNCAGSADDIIVCSTATVTGSIANEWEVDYSGFTLLAKLVVDPFTICVASDNSDYDTLEEIMTALKEDSHSLKIGGAAPPDPDYIGLVMLLSEIGVDINDVEYVVYDGGGESVPALLGGNIDVAVSTTSEFSSYVEAGQLKAVAVGTDEEIGGAYADVPTFIECGYDFTYGNWRGLMGPADIPEECLTYWRTALAEMIETDEWDEVCENMQWQQEAVIDGAQDFMTDFADESYEAMVSAGIIVG